MISWGPPGPGCKAWRVLQTAPVRAQRRGHSLPGTLGGGRAPEAVRPGIGRQANTQQLRPRPARKRASGGQYLPGAAALPLGVLVQLPGYIEGPERIPTQVGGPADSDGISPVGRRQRKERCHHTPCLEAEAAGHCREGKGRRGLHGAHSLVG